MTAAQIRRLKVLIFTGIFSLTATYSLALKFSQYGNNYLVLIVGNSMKEASYTTFYRLSKSKINNFLQAQNWCAGLIIEGSREKSPDDWVTLYDETISSLIQETIEELKLPHQLISEENWVKNQHVDFTSPLIILDPIDGTSGFKAGTKFFSLSLAFMENNQFVSSWVWNFATNEEAILDAWALTSIAPASRRPFQIALGLISDSEFKKKLWPTLSVSLEANSLGCTQINLSPCGSIAYKLLLLYMGQCQFVASKQPKNLWDIAGGTHLVLSRGFKLYCKGVEVINYNSMKWDAPLLWCPPTHQQLLEKALFGST